MTYFDGVNAEGLDQWLNALESNKYKQGEGRLHNAFNGKMCCLGVAAAELGPLCGVHPKKPVEHRVSVMYQASETGEYYYLLMPPQVTAYLGIPEEFIETSREGDIVLVEPEQGDSSDNFYQRNGRSVSAVTSLNDSGVSFKEIARRIRETLTVKEVRG